MNGLGFTAERSLLSSGGRYGGLPGPVRFATECCDITCIGPCSCSGGHGTCHGASIQDLSAAYSISSPLDHCRSTDGRYSCYCPCGCWADDTSYGCNTCPAPRVVVR